MPTAIAEDGHRLWYDAVGAEGAPAIVFPARSRSEFAVLASALAER